MPYCLFLIFVLILFNFCFCAVQMKLIYLHCSILLSLSHVIVLRISLIAWKLSSFAPLTLKMFAFFALSNIWWNVTFQHHWIKFNENILWMQIKKRSICNRKDVKISKKCYESWKFYESFYEYVHNKNFINHEHIAEFYDHCIVLTKWFKFLLKIRVLVESKLQVRELYG